MGNEEVLSQKLPYSFKMFWCERETRNGAVYRRDMWSKQVVCLFEDRNYYSMFVCWLDEVLEREKLMTQEKEGIIDGVISNHSNGKMRGLFFYYFSIKYDVQSSAQSLWKGKFEQKMKVKKRVLIESGELNRLEVSIRMYEIEISEVVQGNYRPLYESAYILPKI